MAKRETSRSNGFVMFKHDTLQTIFCVKCNKSKTSKNVAEHEATGAVICNGCYGQQNAERKG